MDASANIPLVKELMHRFAESTGLEPAVDVPRRYLWTDAFAVCNFLGLYEQTGDEIYKSLALRLVDQVHRVLGRHRSDDPRTGWISGLDDEEGEFHPTLGGLRIGKKLNERKPNGPYDEALEWDQDGQYFHYLTKWMHALHCTYRATGEGDFRQWAVELAKTAYDRFTYVSAPKGEIRMYWKMSIDLSYPLVPSMGHHDPLDGFITFHEVQAGVDETVTPPLDLNLDAEIEGMAALCEGRKWSTDDPLGLGGLLCDALRLAQLVVHGGVKGEALLEAVLKDARFGLEYFARNSTLDATADYRLAFRELGLSIGCHALERIEDVIDRHPERFTHKYELGSIVHELRKFEPLCDVIETFWRDPRSRKAETWKDHLDINTVMLATSLAPSGYLLVFPA